MFLRYCSRRSKAVLETFIRGINWEMSSWKAVANIGKSYSWRCMTGCELKSDFLEEMNREEEQGGRAGFRMLQNSYFSGYDANLELLWQLLVSSKDRYYYYCFQYCCLVHWKRDRSNICCSWYLVGSSTPMLLFFFSKVPILQCGLWL